MKDFISPWNVPENLSGRLQSNKDWTLYFNDYYWIVDIDNHYEFYYNPQHFIGKVEKSNMPYIVLDRISRSCIKFIYDDIYQKALPINNILVSSSTRLSELEKEIKVGNWYYAQGQHYVTYNKLFICDDMYTANLERECNIHNISGGVICDMLSMSARSRTPYYIKNLFDFSFFRGVNTSNIIIKPFYDNWNSHSWASDFALIVKELKDRWNQSSAMDLRIMRKDVFRDTINRVKNGKFISENGINIELSDDSIMIKNTVFYSTPTSVADIEPLQDDTEIEVVNIDCIKAAKQLIDKGYNPAVLNMANRQNPGGGVYDGAGAQEENIFRRSNLFRSLYQFAPYAQEYGLEKSSLQYPMHRDFGGIYTPCVTIFRSGERSGYALLDEPFKTSIISVAGVNRPQLDNNNNIIPEIVVGIRHKMRTILRIGLLNHHDSLVLGALGCGAFRNPPTQIAQLFNEVINEPEFRNKYKLIYFAILEDHNSGHLHNKDGNFKPFAEEFSKI